MKVAGVQKAQDKRLGVNALTALFRQLCLIG